LLIIGIVKAKVLPVPVCAVPKISRKSFAAPDAGSLLKDQQDLQKLNELPKSIPENLFENSIENNSSSTEEDKILVKEFVFDGDIKAFTNDELKKVIADLYNKELTFNEIQSAAVRIKNFYNKKGYFLANATIPRQEVTNGIVIIYIVEGKLDSKTPLYTKS
jgi:hemolysin activation/secretion protein